MTTIIYSQGVLVGDTKVTLGDMLAGNVKKITRSSKGVLAACSGALAWGQLFLKWVEETGGLDLSGCPQAAEHGRGIIIHPDGKVYEIEGVAISTYESPYYILGSGTPFAAGALEMGATPFEAVRVAMKLDVGSGGDVDWYDLAGNGGRLVGGLPESPADASLSPSPVVAVP